MQILKPSNGFCPVQQKYYEVQVRYVDCSTNEDLVRRYSKSGGECEFVKQGNSCDKKCPLIQKMPPNI